MRFSYYRRLSAARKKIYRHSDAVEFIRLPAGHGLEPRATAVADALQAEDQRQVTKASSTLAAGICTSR